MDDFGSTTPLSSNRTTFRSRRPATANNPLPSSSQSNQRHLHQWSLFGQLMEIEGQLPSSSISSTSRRSRLDSDGGISVREHVTSSPGLSPRMLPSGSFHTQISTEPTSYFPIQPIANDLTSNPITYEPESLSSSTATFETPSRATQRPYLPFRLPTFTITHRNILKCAIAYFVASLFTFSPYLSRFISDLSSYGPNDPTTPLPSGHMVATIVVYFNPAKTIGAMIEADLFCFFGLLYSAAVCLLSTLIFRWVDPKSGWEGMGVFLAIVWLGLTMSGLAWMKVWMANPSFNTACSMTAIIIFVVVVKEGGLETLFQVSMIALCGSVISNIVCYIVWPQTAISNLQLSMTTTLESFSTLLPMLTRIFLLEHENGSHITDMEKVQRAVENHQNSFTSLQKNLTEAKSEWAFTRASTETNYPVGIPCGNLSGRESYEAAVDCLNRLAQHLNGLRSGTRLQYDLTKAGIKHHPGQSQAVENDNYQVSDDDERALLQAAATMFGDLVEEVGSPLRTLSSASTYALNRLKEVCSQSRTKDKRRPGVIQPHEFSELVERIEAALVQFESTSNHAVLRLYRRTDMPSTPRPTPSVTISDRHKYEENSLPSSTDNEQVFLVYFFIFTLQEFAKELISLVDAIERIYCYEQQMLLRKSWWMRFFTRIRRGFATVFNITRHNQRLGIRKRLSAYMIPQHRRVHPFFAKIRPHAPDTLQTPPHHQLSWVGKLKRILWVVGRRLKERDTKFAIKAGMALSLLALPAFLESTRPTFVEYWGDWALISFFIVISPTIGATNHLSLQRFLGTLFGAAVAVGLYTLFPEDPVLLSLSGFLFSIPCFYFAVATPQHLSASRFVLLTYNLTCLYCYNLRQKDVLILDIGLYRAIAVMAGILWAALVSRFWWPAEARRELTKSLSDFCLNIGWLYTRLVAYNSFAPEYHEDYHEPRADVAKPTRLTNSIHEFMAMELHLQIKLIELQSLLAQAQHEPRLKGPFPVKLYRGILVSLQTILDKLHSMRCVTTREEWYYLNISATFQGARQDFIVPVNKERREMAGNIILSFSTLAAAFRLKSPLPPYLPPAEKARVRLVDAIRKLDIVKNRDVKVSRQLLFFAYALTMKGVTMELEFLGRTLQDAFGVIGQTAQEFDMLFLPFESRGQREHIA
ncbi:hypothetical protein BYT27DRAFT_7122602 [Phlegmacium glaucopus]|nr:hypothetical protein BYT27DRAFT_7122602 [Phlegmacium glaucopus]